MGFGGSSGISGSINNLLAEWWGISGEFYPGFPVDFTINPLAAANLTLGSNPLYQISDFLAIYPKFGVQVQGILNATPNSLTPGTGYSLNDKLTVVQSDASGGVLQVVGLVSGAPLLYSIISQGTGYNVATGNVTTGGTGTGALVDINYITPSVLNGIPQAVLQMYINLAQACLDSARWLDIWPMAMALFVAHFTTLYLRSEGSVGSTPGRIAASGLTRGIMVSKGAGNVQSMIEVPKGLEEWGAWTQTEYGTQLATFAKVIGMGGMYIL
jgi:Protein of unknown function (DUF4054)